MSCPNSLLPQATLQNHLMCHPATEQITVSPPQFQFISFPPRHRWPTHRHRRTHGAAASQRPRRDARLARLTRLAQECLGGDMRREKTAGNEFLDFFCGGGWLEADGTYYYSGLMKFERVFSVVNSAAE